ncbi:MAG: glycosyltransferase [Lachnospiraceae bacterium]|nr:glycosyltransferase [Lachnospiraceae bacterium]
MKFSVVVPCYNEEDNVELFFSTAVSELSSIIDDTEFIFVNDGSTDKTFERLKELCQNTKYCVKTINFSRNFGKEAGLLAGLTEANGEYVAIIDADLQQRPKYILDMYEILCKNKEYDAVAAYQDIRKEGKILTFFKDTFYGLINKMSEIDLMRSASDFRLLKRCVVDAIISLPEKCRFSKGIFSWVGFNTFYMPYTVEERASGTSKWSFWKLFSYAVDGIVAFSVKPLLMASVAGIILFILALIMMIYTIIKTVCFGEAVAGYPTIVSLILLLSGVQLLCMGILGQYIAKNYTETKNRPVYVIKEKISSKEK